MRVPLLWFDTAELDGVPVPVYLSHAKITPALKGCRAVTVGNLKPFPILDGVFLNAAEPRHVQDRVLFHELLVHGVLWASPFKRSLKSEEAYAYAQSDRAWSVLRQLGFEWPERPKSAAAFERWARQRK